MQHRVVLIGLFVFFSWISQAVNAADKPTPAPSFSLSSAKGKVQLSDYKGQIVLVDFWASWCGPCRESFPWMNHMQQKYGDKGLTIIAINVDQEPELAQEFLKDLPAEFIVAFDPEGITPELYSVPGMPSSYVIDREGNIAATHIGFHTDKTEEYETTLRELLKR